MSNENSDMPQLPKRLAIERKRLGLTQPQLAKVCGTSFRTYCAYEAGETEPRGAFFSALAGVGMDVLFILTGTRDLQVERSLSGSEAALVDAYRRIDPRDQDAIQHLLNSLARAKETAD